ncbi:hypothetical protein PCL_10433 [Purpureocillium lilacinum]|uniref:Uncharacterized protein n=1 Tax=Purpureocillium lilacinum TaxID=33203 RepID=A0A2U3DQE6_PURLI|nr:hypothetical protein PCL_10433 [Purpureocillium lilacinum]
MYGLEIDGRSRWTVGTAPGGGQVTANPALPSGTVRAASQSGSTTLAEAVSAQLMLIGGPAPLIPVCARATAPLDGILMQFPGWVDPTCGAPGRCRNELSIRLLKIYLTERRRSLDCSEASPPSITTQCPATDGEDKTPTPFPLPKATQLFYAGSISPYDDGNNVVNLAAQSERRVWIGAASSDVEHRRPELAVQIIAKYGKPLRPVLASPVPATAHVSFATSLHGDGQFCRAGHCGVVVAASAARAINIQTQAKTDTRCHGPRDAMGAGLSNSFMCTPSGLCRLTVDYGNRGHCAKLDKPITVLYIAHTVSSGARDVAAERRFLDIIWWHLMLPHPSLLPSSFCTLLAATVGSVLSVPFSTQFEFRSTVRSFEAMPSRRAVNWSDSGGNWAEYKIVLVEK